MDSCVRWHKSDCSQPSVAVYDGVPHCHSCGLSASVLVAQLDAQNQERGGNIRLPVEAPLGEANLWWPPCVPYCSSKADKRTDSEPSGCGKDTNRITQQHYEPSSISPIYPSSLDSSHFRLIYLTESDDISPTHIQLEEYAIDDHPEYETVSYVWGGEEGDSTPCKPVYVGSFWDVILTTKNCSAVLRYLRPRKGCRFIWLDAICINQADNIEKPAQISKMGDIYANCERVVAFLGEDLVSSSPQRRFRPRVDFQKPSFHNVGTSPESDTKTTEFLITCVKSAGLTQEQLFERRYLTRIWIVQEILLSKKAIFPLGDFDILCDQKEAMHLVLRTNRELLTKSAIGGKSLSHLLKATSHCHASDPRDRVYGLLGLFKPQDISRKLVPNYALSWRDCWVGTAAYALLVERNLILLTHALGSNQPAQMPSWVPDIRNSGSWFVDFSPANHEQGSLHLANDNDGGDYSDDSPGSGDSDPMRRGSGKWKTEYVMHSVKDEELRISARWAHEKELQGRAFQRLVHPGSLHTRSMESASIDSATGALSLRAIRVFNGHRQVTIETQINGLVSIWVRGPSTAANFRVTGSKALMIPDENYQFFIICCEDSDLDPESDGRGTKPSETALLSLAKAVPEKGSNVVTLHDCYTLHDVHFYSMDYHKVKVNIDYMVTNALHSLHWVLRSLHTAAIKRYASRLSDDWIFPCVFPSNVATTRDLFPLLIRLTKCQSRSGAMPDLVQSISVAAESICAEYNPFIQRNYFHLTIKNAKMLKTLFSMWRFMKSRKLNSRQESISQHRLLWNSLDVGYTYSLGQDAEEWTRLSLVEGDHGFETFSNSKNFPVTVRFSLDPMLSGMKQTTLHEAMHYARQFSGLLNEDLEMFLKRTPRFKDRFVFFEGWGRSLVEELDLVWKLQRITIM